MARSLIQFQKGISLADFLESYGSEVGCHAALEKARWPDGFACPHCGGGRHGFHAARKLHQCSSCKKQTSVTAGTIFHGSKVPLTKWFLAMYWMTQSKNAIAALELMRHLGVQYNTAWLMKQKLAQVMLERNATKPLAGRIEMDDAYLGGEKAGKRGRGSDNKVPFVAAVATREGRPVRLQFRCVAAFSKDAIAKYAKANLEPGAEIVSDGLDCFTAVTEAGCTHKTVITSRIHNSQRLTVFRWVNTAISNLKTSIGGTYHALSRRHAPRCLAEFEYRFNRRSALDTMISRLAWAAVRTEPRTYRWLVPAEATA